MFGACWGVHSRYRNRESGNDLEESRFKGMCVGGTREGVKEDERQWKLRLKSSLCNPSVSPTTLHLLPKAILLHNPILPPPGGLPLRAFAAA